MDPNPYYPTPNPQPPHYPASNHPCFPENRESVGKSLVEVEKRFSDGVPLLDPVEDMKIREPEFEECVRKIEALEQR